MKIPSFLLVTSCTFLSLYSFAQASDCRFEQERAETYCSSGPRFNPTSCRRYESLLEQCLEDLGTKGGGGSGDGPAGNFKGDFSSTRIRSTVPTCESRTSIPASISVAQSGRTLNALFTDTFSNNGVSLKGKVSRSGNKFTLKAKSIGGGIKTKYKIVGSEITPASVKMKYVLVREKGRTTQCSAKYEAVFSRS